jgi:NDP-sugar pyrophosphorylase family protein
LLAHVAATAARIGARDVVVVTGHGAAEVEAAMASRVRPSARRPLRFARQEPQLGTGHAVQQAAPLLPDDGTVVVLSGDVPLIGEDTLRALVAASAGEQAGAADHRVRRPERLRPRDPHRRGGGRGHRRRRAQGRERGAARGARDLQRRDGRARAPAQGLARAAGQPTTPRASTT